MTHRIVYEPLHDLVGADRNPKRHDEPALRSSVDRFGFVEPIVVDGRTGKLVAGHGRVAELRRRHAAGEAPPEGVAADWTVPVVHGWSSNSDAEAEAYLVASNRLSERGGWDPDLLASLLAGLDDELAVVTGWEPDELDDLLAAMSELAVLPGATRSETPSEDRARYEGSGVRAIILTYPAGDFAEVVAQFAAARKILGVPANSDVVLRLLADATALASA